MLSRLIDASGWSHEQWLAATIMAFVVLSVLVILSRGVKLMRMSRRSSYQPNLRPLRRARRVAPSSEADEIDTGGE